MHIDDILAFTDFLIKFQNIHRTMLVKNENRRETDAEHSYQLAMLAWYINTVGDLGLDSDLLIQYSLVHDLVEVYAGDLYSYESDQAKHLLKEKEEKAAFHRIEKEFAEFPLLTDLIREYQAKSNEESKFVYSLDKIIPTINEYLDDGRSWKEFNVSLQMVQSKTDKINSSKYLANIWEQLIELYTRKEQHLFKNRISKQTSISSKEIMTYLGERLDGDNSQKYSLTSSII